MVADVRYVSIPPPQPRKIRPSDLCSLRYALYVELVNIFEIFLPQLLRYPNPSDPLNGEAAALLMRSPDQYATRVKDYVKKYASQEAADKAGDKNGNKGGDDNGDAKKTEGESDSEEEDEEMSDMGSSDGEEVAGDLDL